MWLATLIPSTTAVLLLLGCCAWWFLVGKRRREKRRAEADDPFSAKALAHLAKLVPRDHAASLHQYDMGGKPSVTIILTEDTDDAMPCSEPNNVMERQRRRESHIFLKREDTACGGCYALGVPGAPAQPRRSAGVTAASRQPAHGTGRMERSPAQPE